MHDFLKNTLRSPTDKVLLPAYIGWSPREGSGIFDPVRETGAEIGFYNLNSDLTVDMNDLRSRIADSFTRVLVLVHYFGRTEPHLQAIRSLATAHGILLVEDLAHGFFSAQSKGGASRFGDVSLYSLHKMFPMATGGLVTYRDASLLTGQVGTAPHLSEQFLAFDWQGISEARRTNFVVLSGLLSELTSHGVLFELMWPHLDEFDVPQSLPVRILGIGRDHIYRGMNLEGFGMVSLYHTLIPQVADFANLIDLSNCVINFPVHQDVVPEQLVDMVRMFNELLFTHVLVDSADEGRN
jgi:hypothetical protein